MSAINNQNVDTLLSRINNINFGSTYESQSVKNELETLFSDTNTMNAGDVGAEKIAARIAELEEKISSLEEKAQKVMDRIEEKNNEVKSKQNVLAYTTAEITSAMAKFQKDTEKAARYAAEDAIHSFRISNDSSSFQECFDQAFRKRLGGLQANQAELQILWELYQSNRGAVISISSDIETAINQVEGYETQLKNINATIQLLTTTKNAMVGSTVENAYTNYDMDSTIPVFSGAKEKVANEIIASAGLSMGNIGHVEDATEDKDEVVINAGDIENEHRENVNIEELKAGYRAKNAGTGYNSVWYATLSKNPQLQNLSERINEDNMLETLQEQGMSADEILSFVAENWQVGIQRTEAPDGSVNYLIPNNSGGEEAVFSKLNALAMSTNESNNNEVDTECLRSMQTNALDALDKMYNAGFTFKEAMYTLSIAYPNSGIQYDLSQQSQERNYQVPNDTQDTGTIYQDISNKIQEFWFVTAEKTVDTRAKAITTTRAHCDPITFQEGNTTFAFITDRNNDGKFNYTNGTKNELLGSKDGISELLAYDYNEDGIIDNNDIDENGNSALDNLLLMSNYQDESVNTPQEIENYKANNIFENQVDFNITYTNAKEAGITRIDLRDIKESGLINGEDNVEENYVNVNGSNLINQFTITKDGAQITADETLNTEENLNIFYGQAANHAGNAGTISSSVSEQDFENVFKSKNIESETITSILNTLRELKNSPETDFKYGDITLTEDDIHSITGLAYLTSVMENARKAAEDKIDDKKEAKNAAEEAVDDYFENRIYKDNNIEIESEEESEEEKDKDSEDK